VLPRPYFHLRFGKGSRHLLLLKTLPSIPYLEQLEGKEEASVDIALAKRAVQMMSLSEQLLAEIFLS